jgi:thioredoxin reductase (NADPH)
MLTTQELATIPFLASIPPDEPTHLAAGAADLRLAAGEYAVHEGDERALYIVLSGRVEVTKLIGSAPK